MKLILARHGETIENKKDVHIGWLQGTLSKKGKEQIKSLSKRLKNKRIDIIYTSDLGRCLETTKEISKFHKGVKVIKSSLLREISHGIFEGKSKKNKYWEKLDGNILDRKPKNGESLRDINHRVKKFYNKIIKIHKKDNVLIVTSGGPIRIFQGLIKKIPLEKLIELRGIDNAQFIEFEV